MGELAFAAPGPGSWELDSLHFPRPLTPTHQRNLVAEFPRGFREGTRRYGLLLDVMEHAIVNRFDYITPRIVGAPKGAKGPPPRLVFKLLTALHPEIRRRIRTSAAVFVERPWREDVRRWDDELKPRAIAANRALQAIDPRALDDAALAAHLAACHENARAQVYAHHQLTVCVIVPVGDFLLHVEEWTGARGEQALRALRTRSRVEAGAESEFARVAAAVRREPTILSRSAAAAETIAALRQAPGELGAAARAWLDTVGLRLVTGYDICDLTALELPELLVRTLRAALLDERKEAPLEDPIRVRVPTDLRAAYDELLADARLVSRVRDERALFTDLWAYGIVRRATLEAGRRLAERGRVREAEHLLDASPEEMAALLAGAGPSAEDLAERTAFRRKHSADAAPKRLGPPPSPPPPLEWMPEGARRMTRAMGLAIAALFEEPPAHVVRGARLEVSGIGAAAGVYEGRARLVVGPPDFARIEQGDVLVTRSTSEAFNVILPLLGAVVTDRGGLLCHAATVAREYGIPAVVGTQEATRAIADGASVRVDGAAGTVTVLA